MLVHTYHASVAFENHNSCGGSDGKYRGTEVVHQWPRIGELDPLADLCERYQEGSMILSFPSEPPGSHCHGYSCGLMELCSLCFIVSSKKKEILSVWNSIPLPHTEHYHLCNPLGVLGIAYDSMPRWMWFIFQQGMQPLQVNIQ